MKKYTKYFVALACIAVMVTAAILLAVLWKPNDKQLTKAEYHEALTATQEVVQEKLDSSAPAMIAFNPDDYQQMEDGDEVLLRQNRLLLFLIGVFDNDEFEVTDKVITFKVYDFLGAPEIDFRMKFGIDHDMIFVDFIMNTNDANDTYEFVSVAIDYDYTNKVVRTFTIDDCMSNDENVDYHQSYYDGQEVLTLKENSASEAKTAVVEKGIELRTTTDFLDTNYDFTEEFNAAQADLMGNN